VCAAVEARAEDDQLARARRKRGAHGVVEVRGARDRRGAGTGRARIGVAQQRRPHEARARRPEREAERA
jgi:hypothetical protein